MVISSSSVPWNGSFADISKGRFQDQFDIENAEFNEILGIWEVEVRFHKSPEKTYTFEIDEIVYNNSKAAVGREIKRQLSA